MDDFFVFFPKSRDRWPSPDKSDVENRQVYKGQKRGGLTERIMMDREALPRAAGNFACAFSSLRKQFDGCHGFVSKPA
jgi:hypothetical protein